MVPTFIVIGAQKSATSSLCASLALHPDVFVSRPKELDFFSRPDVYARGWDWYLSLFADADGARAAGEGSTSYTMQGIRPGTAERMARHVPDVRLVYLVRHPLRRIESAWRHLHLTGRTDAPLEVVLRERPQLVDTSCYARQLAAYREHYPDDRVRILFYEDYRRKPRDTLRACYRFLGVDEAVAATQPLETRNVSATRLAPSRRLRLLRRLPGLAALGRRLPARVRPGLQRALGARHVDPPIWEESTLERVIETLRPDAESLLRRAGKSADFWDWEEAASPLPRA